MELTLVKKKFKNRVRVKVLGADCIQYLSTYLILQNLPLIFIST